MVKYRFYWTFIVFSRGHRSKFIWSCFLCRTYGLDCMTYLIFKSFKGQNTSHIVGKRTVTHFTIIDTSLDVQFHIREVLMDNFDFVNFWRSSLKNSRNGAETWNVFYLHSFQTEVTQKIIMHIWFEGMRKLRLKETTGDCGRFSYFLFRLGI